MMAPPRVMRYGIAARRHFHASERPIGWPKWTALGLASAHLSCHHHRRSGWASGSRVNDFEGARHSCAGRLDRHCVSDSRRDGLPCDLGGDLDHGALGASQADRLWTAGEERLWLEILGRRSLRLCRRLSFAFGDFSCRRILAGLLGASRRRARARNRDLRFAIGFHAAFDFGAIFVYSGPNGGQFAPDRLLNAMFHGSDWLTGGKLGPEASLLVFPVITAMFFAFHFLYRDRAPAGVQKQPV